MIGRTLLGRYEIQRLLGEGGMGRVFLAKQADLGRSVVVKVMHEHIAADPKFRERFQRETLLMARFHHPYAITLYDAAVNADAGSCIVMEYVKGSNLETLLEKAKKMTPPRVVRLLTQLCEVLQAAHEEGIIHRDLKPANVMVIDPDTPKERIKVMDFGLAKLIEENDAPSVTDTSIDFAVGTPAYICPEQVRGEVMDHRGDLYSVGVVAFELLAGRVPFKGTSGMDVLLAHATDEPPTFAQLGLADWVPPGIEAVIHKCLSKAPEDRQQSAKQLADELQAALDLATAEASGSHPRLPRVPEDDVLPLVAAGKSKQQNGTPTVQPAPVEAIATPPPRQYADQALPFQMEAWMPESIAFMKLKGYVRDCNGVVLESKTGMVKVRVGKSGWFTRRADGPVDLELRLLKPDPKKPNHLNIHVRFLASHPSLMADEAWRRRCANLFIELRAYLMGGIVS